MAEKKMVDLQIPDDYNEGSDLLCCKNTSSKHQKLVSSIKNVLHTCLILRSEVLPHFCLHSALFMLFCWLFSSLSIATFPLQTLFQELRT